jgi:hypothetical protein
LNAIHPTFDLNQFGVLELFDIDFHVSSSKPPRLLLHDLISLDIIMGHFIILA